MSSAQFITDAAGKRTGVLLPIDEYEELMEDLSDLAAIAQRRDEPSIPHEQVVAEMKADGILDD